MSDYLTLSIQAVMYSHNFVTLRKLIFLTIQVNIVIANYSIQTQSQSMVSKYDPSMQKLYSHLQSVGNSQTDFHNTSTFYLFK